MLKVAGQSGSKSLEAFQQKLDGIAPGTYESLRNRIAEDLAINRLRQQVVMSRIKISDQGCRKLLKDATRSSRFRNQAHVIHIRVSGDDQAALEKTAKLVKAELNNSNDVKAIDQKFTTKTVKVGGCRYGL